MSQKIKWLQQKGNSWIRTLLPGGKMPVTDVTISPDCSSVTVARDEQADDSQAYRNSNGNIMKLCSSSELKHLDKLRLAVLKTRADDARAAKLLQSESTTNHSGFAWVKVSNSHKNSRRFWISMSGMSHTHVMSSHAYPYQ
jgi:hypothetical protein